MYKFEIKETNPELEDIGIHIGIKGHRFDYIAMADDFNRMIKANDGDKFYNTMGIVCRDDLFSFMYFILNLPVNDPFIMARIYEVQDNHEGTIDLWAREHWKSMIITYALTIWTWLKTPEARQCIFSHTRTISKSFLRQIKLELENNELLKACYPDIFWENPVKEAPKWSEDDGLFIKRKTRAKEASLEAWGLVDGLPTSKHFSHRIYDDIVTEKNVSTPAQMKKALDAYHQSIHLGARGGQERVIGTRYGSGDVYATMIKEKGRIVRIYPAEVDEKGAAKFKGIPVLLTREELDVKFEKLSEFNYSSQMLQDPVAKSEQKFRLEWVRYYRNLPYVNLYMVVDPAGRKDVQHDYTVICVIGVDSLRNFFLVDMVRDKFNLGERWIAVKDKVQEWGITNPIGYESYGMQSDLDYFKERQDAEGIYFHIEALGGQVTKPDRIKRLIPLFSRGRFFLPYALPYTDSNGTFHELILEFIQEEYEKFPFISHDDMMDCMARIMDSKMNVTFPSKSYTMDHNNKGRFDPMQSDEESDGSWMSV